MPELDTYPTQFTGAVIQKRTPWQDSHPGSIVLRRIIDFCDEEFQCAIAPKLPFTTLASLAQLTFGRLLPKPNKRFTVSLLLEESELFDAGWKKTLQQSWPMGVVKDRTDPIYVRARESKSTSSRRMFKKTSDVYADSIMTSVSPFVSAEDAAIVVTRFEKGNSSAHLEDCQCESI